MFIQNEQQPKQKQHRKRFTRQETLFKTLLQRKKQDDKISLAIRNLGWIPLEKPIFGGYERYFAIRPDLLTADNATTAELQKVLQYVQREERNNSKNFQKRQPRTRRLVPTEHQFRRVSVKSYNKMDKKLQAYFMLVKSPFGHHYWDDFEWVGAYYYVLCKPWQFVSRTRKYYITEVREHDNVLLQEQAECEFSLLERCFFYSKKGRSMSNNAWKKRNCNHRRAIEKNETRKLTLEYLENSFFEI